jgi:DNA-binding LacI/PurR family transcriptional regulator
MSSVREIARTLGVSPATVSRAINNHPTVAADVRARVLAAVNRSGYTPAVGKRSTTNIAFLYTGASSLGSPYDAAVMQGMADRMDDLGFDLMILNTARALLPGESFTQLFHRKSVRGAVIRTEHRTRHLVEMIAEEGFPVVVIGDRFENVNVSSIHCESRKTSAEAVEHLISLGHKRIGVCVNLIDDSDHLDRLDGYCDALASAGMEFDERLVYREYANLEGGTQLIRKLRAMRDPPTALYIGDPFTAVGAINEASRFGIKVPDDLSVVGFDDGELRFITQPQMTAVVQDAREIGKEAFEVLHQMIEQRRGMEIQRKILPTRFELHESSARPRT